MPQEPFRHGSIEPTDDTVMMANCEDDYLDWVEWLVAEATVEHVAGWWGAVRDLVLQRDSWLLSAPQQALRAAAAAGDLAALASAVSRGADALSCCGALHLAACAHGEAVISLLQRGCAVDAVLPAAPWSRLALCNPLPPLPAPENGGAEGPFDAMGGREATLRYVESALAGASPLHCAALCGHAANVHLLLAAGARAERCNARGDSAADLAMLFEPLHTPMATHEILAALASTSQSHCVVVYSHVCMQMQTATCVRRHGRVQRLEEHGKVGGAVTCSRRSSTLSTPHLSLARRCRRPPCPLPTPALPAADARPARCRSPPCPLPRPGQGGDAAAEERACRRAEQRVAPAGRGGVPEARTNRLPGSP